ncbi:MAG TPA: ABC transporter permease subunit [Stellaceae bacterium]|nr:ABC transporter permease subunit [Stellaceae bacterium]
MLRLLGWACLVLTALVCLAPPVVIVLGGLSEGSPFGGLDLTVAPWLRAIDSPQTLSSIGYSFLLSLRVPVALVVAFTVAWYLARNDVFGKRTIMYVLWLAFFLPILPATLGWILLLDPNFGLVNQFLHRIAGIKPFNIYSLGGITWLHVTLSTIPIMVILIEPAQRLIDASYEEASTMSGAGTFTTLRRVTLPLIAPTLLTALIAALIKALEAFEVEQLLGVPAGILVYSTRVFNLLEVVPPDDPQAMALSTFFLALLFALIVPYRLMLQRSLMMATLTGKGARLLPRQRTRGSNVVSGLLFLTLAVTVLVPFSMVAVSSFSKLFGFYNIPDPWTLGHWRDVLGSPEFLNSLTQSILVGLVVAGAGTILYLTLAWFIARNPLPGKSLLSLAIWLPWAIPGVLLGSAFLSLYLNVPGLRFVYGTVFALMIVLIVQGLPFATHMFEASIGQVGRELEESSLMAGASRFETVTRITAPLIAPMVASILVLSFMAAMKDISATVLVATPGTATLPLLMFSYATSGQLERAAVIGVVTVVVAVIMALLATTLGDRSAVAMNSGPRITVE